VSDDITAADAARAAIAAAEGNTPVAVATAVDHNGAVRRMLVAPTGAARGTLGDATLDETALRHARDVLRAHSTEPLVHTVQLGTRGWLLYIEAHFPPEQLVIVGAGHIAVPLAQLGARLDFRVTVLDDREEFATTERFADDVVVRRADFESDPFAGVAIGTGTYVALVTRGHLWDFDCLRRLVEADARPRYIGMIGSRRRVRAAFHALLAAGTPREVLARIHAPIGLEIGAETPAEIAVAIAAELIAVRRGATGGDRISARERVLERLLKEEP
jgi:xanthine dehydrogenase accessory factor